MKNLKENWEFLEQLCKNEELDVSYISIEFPDGTSYEYQSSSIDFK